MVELTNTIHDEIRYGVKQLIVDERYPCYLTVWSYYSTYVSHMTHEAFITPSTPFALYLNEKDTGGLKRVAIPNKTSSDNEWRKILKGDQEIISKIPWSVVNSALCLLIDRHRHLKIGWLLPISIQVDEYVPFFQQCGYR